LSTFSAATAEALPTLDPAKFRDPRITAKGEKRAAVALNRLETLWFNTGTLCNLTCSHCYIESSPTNDSLVYLTAAEVETYLDELDGMDTEARPHEIGFTGGEPFMNPDMIAMLELVLERGYRALVLTNAMRPMLKVAPALLAVREAHGDKLTLRISVDHYTKHGHELERGEHAWRRMLEGVQWLSDNGFNINVAGRTFTGETDRQLRAGFARLFADLNIAIDADNHRDLVLFPEMDETVDVPEITEACWGILNVSPDAMMCASSRMVVKRKGEDSPVVLPCTLLPYDTRFEMGTTLTEASGSVALNHPHCAKFCVLGGGSCSVAE
jgi:MoaA/NifB/PqqE/SkfB family radical SAM enzyme